ncbi:MULTISPECIES: metal-binding protein [unclassified Methanosarcina]|uniref:metal-binding protein n=1 Tax=unclassified Methanosarcina TaxID=2644672 RepID=UPI00064FF5FA|nr:MULTISPECIES: metal-binding protein [unclassified Methanosarcina]
MPNGKTHTKINIILLFGILLGLHTHYIKSHIPLEYLEFDTIAIFSFALLFGTYYLSPDLDTKSEPFKRWGILKYIWWPYQKIFKHRGKLHHPLSGPIIIISTVSLFIIAPVVKFFDLDINQIPTKYLISLLSGIVVSIEAHIIADMIYTKVKIKSTKIKKKLKNIHTSRP